MTSLSVLNNKIAEEFQLGNIPKSAKIDLSDMQATALNLSIEPPEFQRWYIPQLMHYSISNLITNFPVVVIEQLLFAFDPDGSFRDRHIDLAEATLYEERSRFLDGFNGPQKKIILEWLDVIADFSEVENYFRAIDRIRRRFSSIK